MKAKNVSWPCAPMEQKYISHFPEERQFGLMVPDMAETLF